ncbi:MAG: FAD-binding oxidoreductase [Candidatus Brocadiae bacterium]|nr:FAD-binding oxidoreductase [Candidatus Brocadiia bacterium]
MGEEGVSTDPALLQAATRDYTEVTGTRPDVIVHPGTVEQVQAVVRFAAAGKIPVTPVVASSNVGGLALCSRGGILLNLSRMNRILETREEDMYMVVEPGVQWGQVKEHLERNHPTLRYGYPLAPPDTGVVANALLDGLLNLSLRFDTNAKWLNGVEAVLPSGEIVRTGAAAWTRAQWCTGSPMPDLTGLFINFHGTTGIVTKASLRLQVAKRIRTRFFLMGWDTDAAFALVKALVREEICDDLGVLSWPVAKMLFGEARPVWRDPAEPLVMVYADVSSNRQKEMDLRLEILNEHVDASKARGAAWQGPLDVRDLIRIEPRFRTLSDFPARLDFLLDHPGGGLSWVGTFGPCSRWEEGARASMAVMERRGFPPIMVARPMAGGHFGVLRLIETFDRTRPEEDAAVLALNRELVDLLLPMGFVPYKTPPWVFESHASELDAGFRSLLRTVRTAIDPAGILNPGKWPV